MERTAQQAYLEHRKSISETLRQIEEWYGYAPSGNFASVDWGDVGDVTEVDTQLKTVLEFIKSIPQG